MTSDESNRGLAVENDLRVKVSRYVSYLLRHNPEDLELDDEGFVELSKLISKLRKRVHTVDKKFLIEIVEQSERRRFEIVGDKIRALHGHTIDVHVNLKEDTQVERLYHGTTPEAAEQILEKGLQPMKRRWVHLSPTKELAYEVGKRRTDSPIILTIDVTEARNHGLQFFKATDKVYVCLHVPAKYIKKFTQLVYEEPSKERSSVKIREIECKSLLNQSRLADYCINPYVGCQHACRYCYAESYTRRFTKHTETWGDFVDVKVNAPMVLARETKKKTVGRVYISSLTDAYQPLERKYELTRKLLEILLKHQFPISIQTKSALVLRDFDLIRKFHEREVGFTITSLDDQVRKAFEPLSSSAEEKLSAIKQLKDNCVRTYVFFGPVLPYISDQNMEQYFKQISVAGADYVLIDKLNLKPGLWTSLENYLTKESPQLKEDWKNTLLNKNEYYQNLKTQIGDICKALELECKFCY